MNADLSPSFNVTGSLHFINNATDLFQGFSRNQQCESTM